MFLCFHSLAKHSIDAGFVSLLIFVSVLMFFELGPQNWTNSFSFPRNTWNDL